ncbi:molybdopterin molybdochelatase [Curtobacterium sp. PhB130]|uniref:molybdopterin molybdotransferase MoeA n=1 Tax=unclassified Curtobacterium TaxID=257496 RepID=UPI000F4BE51C|nr:MULTISPECIES: gephyrin-like molybdotransferase Glp [unclassified Curtobacterium]ROS75206.1 molybdopterin molybdochelatase [Curtobacterium sp. PhB130]TCK63843.1 molybdopterin molybdochelatase [Curtobacterium sp. PhB136]
MRSIGQHRQDIEALVEPVVRPSALRFPGPEAVAVDDLAADTGAGHGYRVLGRAVGSPIPLPPFDNSQMDGFAVRAADAGSTLRVVAPIPAGVVPAPLAPGSAAPIMTGARIPDGADAVFPVEATLPGAFPAALSLASVDVPADLAPGTFVRATGSDLGVGETIVDAGAALTPAVLGALASAGVTHVELVRRPRALVVSTGSELGGASAEAPGGGDGGGGGAGINDANGVALRAALAEVGVESRTVRVPDDEARFLSALDTAVGDWADLVLTTGGISAGAYEVVRQALEPRGLAVTPVAMQPGGPQAFGTVEFAGRPVPVVSFPGNPVSALVSFEVFLRPVLARAAGMPDARPTQTLPAASAATSPEGKHQVRRGRVADGRVHFVGGPSSHLLAHYADATHLVHVPVGTAAVEPGDPLTVWSIR